jgi:hypothetical protein
MKRRINSGVAAAIIAALAIGLVLAGKAEVRKKTEEYAALEKTMPEAAIDLYLEELKAGDYEALYEDSLVVETHFNSQEDYTAKVKEVYDGVDLDSVEYACLDNEDGTKDAQLYADGTFLATLRLKQNDDGTWTAGTIFVGDQDYRIEVPTGLEITVNGLDVGTDNCLATGVAASNFAGLNDTSRAPLVDVYELTSLLGEPEIAVKGESGYSVLKDVLSSTLYVGKTATDETLAETMVADALICAKFPAQEATVVQVGAISIQDSDWWDRISGMQNTWFTSHSTSSFSNEQAFNIIQQSEDTMVGYVTFDYYASNGDVSRTWYGGYQMTFLKENGTWKIAGMAVDSELNPERENYFEELNS